MDCYSKTPVILMEGALGERLKKEYGICFDETLGLAGLVYDHEGRTALTSIWNEYIGIADEYQMPLLVTTPTRRANRDRVSKSAYGGHHACTF